MDVSFRRQLSISTDVLQHEGRAILSRLLIDLSWASSHLEGNTYSRLDTRELIEHGKTARGGYGGHRSTVIPEQ
jgi:hypothetical protein